MTTKYYHHPHVTSNGMIMYSMLPYPCPESKQWNVLDQALSITIPKIYHAVMESSQSSEDLKDRAQRLYTKFIAGRGCSISNYDKMDSDNKNVADIAATEGWEKAAKHMLSSCDSYAEMRAKYG